MPLTDLDHAIDAPPLPGGLDTPALVVDLDRTDANIARMQRSLDERGLDLRPHAKTHKSPFVAHRQLAAGAVGMTVAVLGEAQVLADHGIDDVFVAYPVWAVGAKAERLRELAGRIRLAVGVDSVEGATQLGRALAGGSDRPDAMIEIDSGDRRTGTTPRGVVEVARAAIDAGLHLRGVFTHGGHSYGGPDRVTDAADDERTALAAAIAALDEAGLPVDVVSAGSTPTAAAGRPPITEERPGTYVFGDRQQVNLGATAPDAIALVVAATVVSTQVPGRCVLDAGAKALAKDQPAWLDGFGVVPAIPGAIVTKLADHHAVVELPPGLPAPAVGEVVAVVPNHVCPVVNLFDRFTLTRDGEVVDRLPVSARGRTS